MEEGWRGRLGLEDMSLYRVDKQQGPTVQHRELYSMSCEKPSWKRMQKITYIHIKNHTYMHITYTHYSIQITNKDLLHSTGNYTQYSGITYEKRILKRMNGRSALGFLWRE